METEPAAESNTPVNEEWIDLSGDGGVLKKVRSPELSRKIGSDCLYIQQLLLVDARDLAFLRQQRACPCLFSSRSVQKPPLLQWR